MVSAKNERRTSILTGVWHAFFVCTMQVSPTIGRYDRYLFLCVVTSETHYFRSIQIYALLYNMGGSSVCLLLTKLSLQLYLSRTGRC